MGPFFGFAVIGGGLGSWIVTRLREDEEEGKTAVYPDWNGKCDGGCLYFSFLLLF